MIKWGEKKNEFILYMCALCAHRAMMPELRWWVEEGGNINKIGFSTSIFITTEGIFILRKM